MDLVTGAGLQSIAELGHLRTLSLDFQLCETTCLTPVWARLVARHCPHLARLSFRMRVLHEDVMAVLCRQLQLSSLTVDDIVDNLGDRGLRAVADNAGRSLGRLYYESEISMDGVRYLLGCLRSLTRLVVWMPSQVTEQLMLEFPHVFIEQPK